MYRLVSCSECRRRQAQGKPKICHELQRSWDTVANNDKPLKEREYDPSWFDYREYVSYLDRIIELGDAFSRLQEYIESLPIVTIADRRRKLVLSASQYMTQEQIAEQLGVDVRTVQRIIRAK